MTLYEHIERLVLAGAVSRVQLRPDLYLKLVKEVRADAWGMHEGEGPTWAVNVGGVLVTKREPPSWTPDKLIQEVRESERVTADDLSIRMTPDPAVDAVAGTGEVL